MAASAYHVISTEVENHIFKTNELLDTSAFINNPHRQSSGVLIFLCKYYIVISDILVGSFLHVLFLLLAVILSERHDWKEGKERLSYRKKCIEQFVWGISPFWLHALLSMSFSCFLCLLPPPSQVMHLRNGSYKDTYIAMGGILCDDIMSKRSKKWKSII